MTRNPHRFFSLPLLPIVAGLMAGATAGGATSWCDAAIVSIVFFTLLITGWAWKKTALSRGAAVAAAGCFFVALFSVFGLVHPSLPENHVVNFAGRKAWIVEGRILPPLDPGLTRTHVTVNAEALLTHDQRRIPVCGRLRLTVNGPYTQTVFVGDRIRFVSTIRRIRPPGNPFGFDYRRFLGLRRVYALARVRGFSQLVVLRGGGMPSWRGMVDRIRQHLNRWIMASIPSPTNALAAAFLIGYRGQVSPTIRETFVRCGTVHLIAISGLHLGIVSVLLYLLFRQILGLFPRVFLYMDVHRITAILTMAFLFLYLMLTGARVSTIRAFIMAASFLAVLFFRRTSHLMDILLLAAFVILFFQPQAMYYVSFQLTFAAVAGILIGVSRRGRETSKGDEEEKGTRGRFALWIGSVLLVTLLAMAATFPIVASHFHRASPMGLIANLFGIPYVGFVMLPIGLMSLALYPFSHFLATLLLQVDGFFIQVLVQVFRFLAGFPHSRGYIFPPRWFEIVFYYAVFVFTVFAFRARHRGIRRRYFILTGMGVALLVASFVMVRKCQNPTVAVFSVRQGTYMVASSSEGHAAVVCCGLGGSPTRDDAKWVLIPYLLHRRVTDLDIVAVTNNEPVNLTVAGEIIAYKQPRYLLGTRQVLYSLKATLPRDYPGITWVVSPSSLRVDDIMVKTIQESRQRPGRRQRVDTVLSFEGLRAVVPSLRGMGIPTQTSPQPTFLITSTFHSFHEKPPWLGKDLWIIRYPKGYSRRGRGTRKGFYDLRRDGAVVMEKRGNMWHVKTFLTHRRCVIPSRYQ